MRFEDGRAKLAPHLASIYVSKAYWELEEEESDDELASIPKEMKTKSGYLKDNFVVDDNNNEAEETEDEIEEEEDFITEDDNVDDISNDEVIQVLTLSTKEALILLDGKRKLPKK